MGQGIMTLFRKPADGEDGRLVSQKKSQLPPSPNLGFFHTWSGRGYRVWPFVGDVVTAGTAVRLPVGGEGQSTAASPLIQSPPSMSIPQSCGKGG